jgi:hypothetical protein
VVTQIKDAELAITVVTKSVEDELDFSTLGFMKSKLRNRLGICGHFEIYLKMFSLSFLTQSTFFTMIPLHNRVIRKVSSKRKV